MIMIEIVMYATGTGQEPFSDWQDKLDKKTKAIIMQRLDRIRFGNFGDAKRLQGVSGIWEFRIDYGPGYRVYFGKEGSTIVILLTGGSKKNQIKDIAKAKQYWLNYKGSL